MQQNRSSTVPPPESDGVVVEQSTYSPDETQYGGDTQRGQEPAGHLSNRQYSDYDSLIIVSSRNSMPEPLAEKPGKKRRHTYQLWKWELLASLLSVASLAVVVVVLYIENGRPLDEWAWSIGPTAVISFIGAVSKASLLVAVNGVIGQLKWQNFYGQTNSLFDLQLFDDSARGPLGAATLIWHKNIRAALASLAAVVIITSLLVDPFMQLVFDFPTLSKLTPDESGAIQKTTIYDPEGYNVDAQLTGYVASAINNGMQSAIIRAVTEQPSSLAASCSTGNCTWTRVSTLAICSDCSNVTSQVRVICPNTRPHQCNYFFPSGNNISGEAFEAEGNYFFTVWNSSATSLYLASQNPGSHASLTNFDAVQLNGPIDFDVKPVNLFSNIRYPTAWSCSMSFCTKTYESVNMNNGIVNVSSPRVHNLVNTGATSNITTSFEFYSSLRHLREEDSTNPLSTEYIINDADYSNIASYLTEIFSTGWAGVGFVVSNRVEGARSPNLGWKLGFVPDLALTVRNMAESMTEVIRTSRNSTLDTVQASRIRTYIQVHFAWLALPITITVLSLVLVIWVVVGTGRSDLPMLKNSSLALLAYKVDGWAPEQLIARGEAALTGEAKVVQITLPKELGGLGFVRVGNS
ncbi:hypothetical protein HD806DRAFT_525557 [Xylariaceae sp. AK1471]|nr:hypothetical protein HD806DRAFT_525557 [Xylariaceae sp. AK1471]